MAKLDRMYRLEFQLDKGRGGEIQTYGKMQGNTEEAGWAAHDRMQINRKGLV